MSGILIRVKFRVHGLLGFGNGLGRVHKPLQNYFLRPDDPTPREVLNLIEVVNETKIGFMIHHPTEHTPGFSSLCHVKAVLRMAH